MSDLSQIDVQDLRLALMRVLDGVEARLGETVDLQADYYWTLDLRQSFEPHADQVSGLIAGQLSDDVREVRRMAARSDEPVIWHDVAHIVGVLRRIAALDLPPDAL
jgi:hypothetical protein